MSDYLATQASWWAYSFNVEAVWCEAPTFEDVIEGTHRVVAYGNDGMGVVILVNNEKAEAAHGHDDAVVLVELAFLGRSLTNMRHLEMLPEVTG